MRLAQLGIIKENLGKVLCFIISMLWQWTSLHCGRWLTHSEVDILGLNLHSASYFRNPMGNVLP